MIEKIKDVSKDIWNDVIKIRRDMHMHPELSYEEKWTSSYIANELSSLGIEFETGIGGFGLVASISGQQDISSTIALRADMDALPIQEKNDIDYRSSQDGKMHACGHDVHTSSLLGTVRILNELKDQWSGNIKCIFQPAEEKLPGGAKLMIEDGVLENPRPGLILGQHVHPEFEVGTVGFRSGPMMASSDEIYITIIGRGGHGALPQNCIDPILIASQVVIQLQALVSRFSDPTLPSVLTIGKITSEGGATNIIPNQVTMLGTFRTLNEEWRGKAHGLIENLIYHCCQSYGAKVDVNILQGYPTLNNDYETTEKSRVSAMDYLGEANVVDMPLRMTSEDFAYYTQELPSCFYRLGTSNRELGINSPVHTDTFNVDESCLQISTGLMAHLAIESLIK